MDSTMLLLILVPLALWIIFNAVKFMRFLGFLTGGARRTAARDLHSDNHLSFDERVAERLRELNREQR